MKRYTIVLGAFVALISACSSTGEKHQEEQKSVNCQLSYADKSINVKWTAYKTSERVGVSGTFDTVLVSGTSEAAELAGVLANASFSIPTSSVNSANPDRDGKIFRHFFSTMVETSELKGKVLEATETELKVLLTMNGVTDTVPFSVSRTDSVLNLVGNIELADYQAVASADSLNQVCFDLHKGADGISKLWPDVKLEISALLNEVCE
jgi:polyisoprenoid-binding protein YceI